MSSDPVEALLAGGEATAPILLVRGERALAEPLAERLAARLAEAWQTEPIRLRHPETYPRSSTISGPTRSSPAASW